MSASRRPCLAFGPFIADPETGRLMRGDQIVPLTPQPFAMLCHLLRSERRLVSKAELLDALWRDASVSENVLAQCVADIRRALGDTARSPQYVETVHRRGYRFLAPVRVVVENEVEEIRAVTPARRGRPVMALVASMVVVAVFGIGMGIALHRVASRRTPPADATSLRSVGRLSDTASDSLRRYGGVVTDSAEARHLYADALDIWFRVGGQRGAEAAEARLDQALSLDPSFAQAYVRKAELQQWRRQTGYGDPDPRPAIVAAVHLVKHLPQRERLLIAGLDALIVEARRDVAVRRLGSLLETDPLYAQEAGVPSLLLEALMRQGRWEDMIRTGQAQLASASLPEYQQALVSSLLAEAYRHKGELGPAIENARRAVMLWPFRQTPEWLRQKDVLGRLRLDDGQRNEAVADFREIADAPVANIDNLTHAAWGLYMAGERAEALSIVERALKLDASYGNAYHLRGWIEMANGEYSRAAADLERAYAKTPPQYGGTHHGQVGGDLAALYYAGVAWQKAGEPALAKGDLERVVDHCRTLERHFGDQPGAAARWQAANFLGRAEARLGGAISEPPRLPGDDTTYFVQSARLDALHGRKDVALTKLAQGLALGFGERRHILDDPDFESLRSESEFRRLVE